MNEIFLVQEAKRVHYKGRFAGKVPTARPQSPDPVSISYYDGSLTT